MKKAFTLIELLVAITLIGAIIFGSSIVFRMAADATRTADATAEISRKLRAITDQLNADFKELDKDGEIAFIWNAVQDADGNYDRFDRIFFFTRASSQSYNDQPAHPAIPSNGYAGPVYGDNALVRVSYMIAKNGDRVSPAGQNAEERILSRTQHILTSDAALDDLPDFSIPLSTPAAMDEFWLHNYRNEYDKMGAGYVGLQGWLGMDWADKELIFEMILDIEINNDFTKYSDCGTVVDKSIPETLHMLFCEGVGQFSVQGWYDAEQRWLPEVDPDGNGILTNDSDFRLNGNVVNETNLPGVLYPGRVIGLGDFSPFPDSNPYPPADITKDKFNSIPGLGRALKFTFTLYDSNGVFPDGKTFTHIVYLDN